MAANTAKRQKFTEKANRAFAGVTEPEVREARTILKQWMESYRG